MKSFGFLEASVIVVTIKSILTETTMFLVPRMSNVFNLYEPRQTDKSCLPLVLVSMVLYMSFDKFLLAVESCDLSQADKIIIRLSSFPKLSDW